MHELSISLWQRLVSVSDLGSLDMQAIRQLAELGLIETPCDPRLSLQRRWVRCNDRVLDLAMGHLRVDCELAQVASIDSAVVRGESTPALRRALETNAFVTAVGASGAGRSSALVAAVAEQGGSTLRIHSAALARDAEALARQLRVIARESRILECAPIFVEIDAMLDVDDGRLQLFNREVLRMLPDCAVLATSTKARRSHCSRAMVVHEVGLPSPSQRVDIWNQALAGADAELLEAVGIGYSISPGIIVAAASNALADEETATLARRSRRVRGDGQGRVPGGVSVSAARARARS